MTLLGPSGCGKTTTLRIIGGFERPTTGRVLFDGEDITNLPPYKRRVNTVFQRYALFPHLNVFENIAFGLKVAKRPKDEIEERVQTMLNLVNLSNFGKRGVESLSGGQQQRVAIARALVNEPEVLLLDEPLGALDVKLRKDMQLELKRMQQRLGITFVFVTHDQEEALTMSDTIVVMKDGLIQQIGTPKHIYDEPKSAFVADFIGETNMFRHHEGRRAGLFLRGGFPVCGCGLWQQCARGCINPPEDVVLTDEELGQLVGTVKSVLFKGVHYEMIIDAGEQTWKVHSTTMRPKARAWGYKWCHLIFTSCIPCLKGHRYDPSARAPVGRMDDGAGVAGVRGDACAYHQALSRYASLAVRMALRRVDGDFTVLPLVLIAYYSFTDKAGNFTLTNFANFWDSNFEMKRIDQNGAWTRLKLAWLSVVWST